MAPQPSENTVGVYIQIIFLILCSISSSLANLLRVTVAPVLVCDIFDLTVNFKFMKFIFRIFLLFFLQCLLTSLLTLFGLSTLLWLGSCNYYILACFLWSKNRKHPSSNHGVCCFNSYRHRFSLADVLIFYLMFSQALFMFSLSFKFSKAVNLPEILICYSLLTSSSLSFLRLNLSTSNFRAFVYLLPIFP